MLLADCSSQKIVWNSLVRSCGVRNKSSTNFTVNHNKAVQYYCASSYALLLKGYNNSQSLNASHDASTIVMADIAPLSSAFSSSYLTCLNTTNGNNVPLLYDENETSGAAAGRPAPLDMLLARAGQHSTSGHGLLVSIKLVW